MVRVEAIEYTKTVRQALTAREVEKLRIACGSDVRDNAILEVFLATGCRVSEVAGMKIEGKNAFVCLEKEIKKELSFLERGL